MSKKEIYVTAKCLQKFYSEYYKYYNYKDICPIWCMNETNRIYIRTYKYNEQGYDFEKQARNFYNLDEQQINLIKKYDFDDYIVYVKFSVDSYKNNVFYEIKQSLYLDLDYNLEFFSKYKDVFIIYKKGVFKEVKYEARNIDLNKRVEKIVKEYSKAKFCECYTEVENEEDIYKVKNSQVVFNEKLYEKFHKKIRVVDVKTYNYKDFIFKDVISEDDFRSKYL